jgi:hypothetical protein
MDRSKFIRGLLDDPRDPQLPQQAGFASGFDANPLIDMLTTVAAQPYRSQPGTMLSSAPGKMMGAIAATPGFAKDMATGAVNSAVNGFKMAHQAWPTALGGEGRFDPNNPEDFAGAQDLAGLMAGGAVPFESPAGALRAGPSRPKAPPPAVPQGLLDAGAAAKKNTEGLLGRTAYGPEQDLLFNGKAPKDFTPEDWGAFGAHHGVPNIGPASNAEFEASLKPYQDTKGRTFTVPGGIEDTEKPFTYYDLLHLKAQGIDPNDLHPDIHRQLHNRLVKTMSPEGPVSNERLLNQYMMGMISPNNPLTPNEFAVASMMAKEGDNSISRIANMTPWTLDTMPPATDAAKKMVREPLSNEITSKFGLQAADRGGTGASGTADYTRISDVAKMMEERPDFFRFRGEGEGGKDKAENWLNFVSRIASQVPGLSAKTGSFSTVWQNPADAAISAIDRHMATQLNDSLFTNQKEKAAFEKTVVDFFNKDRAKKEQIKNFNDVMAAPGGRGAYVEQVMNFVNKHGNAKYRTAKGEINPNVPESMQNMDWVREPRDVVKISEPYLRALEENDRLARQNGQGLFANQWMLWDRIRNRIEPHEVMFPGLEKLPRMSHNQLMDAFQTHMQSGYGTAPFVPKQVQNPSSMAHFTLGGSPLGLLSDGSGLRDEQGVPVM